MRAAVAATAIFAGAATSRAAEMLVFEQPGCVYCERFETEVAPNYAAAEEGRAAPLRRIDISRQDESGATLSARVRLTPTFVLVDGGREVGRLTGYPGKEYFWIEIAALTAKLPQTAQREER